MELITYNLTLDTHKNGVQTTLQGINVGDVLSRKIAISLTEGSSSYELPTGNLQALMYVTKPGSTDPSINACTIDDDRIIYTCNASDFESAGTVIYQLKIIDTRIGGANGVYVSAKFAADVWESDVSDSAAETSTTYTALENAVAQATEVYNSRLVSVVLDDDKMFIVTYADGTTYESDVIQQALSDIDQVEEFVGRAETAATLAEGYVNDCIDYVDDCEEQVTLAEYQVSLATGQVTLATAKANASASSAATSSSCADMSKSYAVGTNGTVRPGDNDDNAKHYKEVCEQIAGSMQGGFIPMGTITFSSLPTTPTAGWMYNISDEFTSDSRFKDGGGKNYASGTNVYATADLMWDCLSGAIPVVNGKSGNSITLDGADLILDGYAIASAEASIIASDTINDALGKLEKKADDVPTKISNAITPVTNMFSAYVAKVDVVNALTSDETNLPLSAKQGKVLNGEVENMISAVDSLKIYATNITASSGAQSVTVSNTNITEASIIDVYYAEASKETVAAAKPSYSQAAGVLTITFENALEADITIDVVHIVNM